MSQIPEPGTDPVVLALELETAWEMVKVAKTEAKVARNERDWERRRFQQHQPESAAFVSIALEVHYYTTHHDAVASMEKITERVKRANEEVKREVDEQE